MKHRGSVGRHVVSPWNYRRLPALLLLLGLTCAVALWLCAPSPAPVAAQDAESVLILHSYNQGLAWTDGEDDGIRSALRKVPNLDIHTEYLDTKLVSSKAHYRLFYRLLKDKYRGKRFSVVIATDDDAYNFFLKYHDSLFPGARMVFCGVNYFNESDREGREDLFTGVVESFDVPATLDAALRLHPQASRVVVINDRTTTGLANKKILTEKVIPRFSKRVRFVFFDNQTMPELLERVSRLSPNDIVLLMTSNQDRSGRVFTYDESIGLISRSAQVPMYGVWDFYLGKGIVGGRLISGFDQGRLAGQMAVRVLESESVSSIPVVTKSPSRYAFDYRQLARFGLSRSQLPPGSDVINVPVAFYDRYRTLVWSTAAAFLALILIIVLLLVYIRLRRRAESALRNSEEKYRTLVDNVDVGVARTTPSGRYVQVNPAMARILGFASADLLMQTSVLDIYRDPADRERLFDELREKGVVRDVEIPMKKQDATPILASLTITAKRDEKGAIQWVDSVVDDITERKRADEELREKDRAVRQAYADVIDAATGGKLVLITADEVGQELGEVVMPPKRIAGAADLAQARRSLEAALRSISPLPHDISAYVLAASEALTNVVKYGSGGEYSVRMKEDRAQIIVTDFGPGIDFHTLPRATLVPGFSTQMSLGMGFTIMLQVADRVLLATQPSLTTVILEKSLAES